jgi:hypothetical protein
MLLGFAQGQIPSESECLSSFETAGLEELQSSLTPCAFSASSTCCSNIDNLVALDADSEFAGCLCNQGVIDLMIEEIESNSLAQSIGFDGDKLMDVLKTCNAPIVGTSECARAPSPPSVAVDIETPGVSVTVDTVRVPSPPEEPDTMEPVPMEPSPKEPTETQGTRSGGRLDGFRDMMGKPGTMRSGFLGKKKGLKHKKKHHFPGKKGLLYPEPEESTTFEDARKKLDIIKKNLANTRDTITNSKLDKSKKVLDMKAGTMPSRPQAGMDIAPKMTAPARSGMEAKTMNGDMMTLIPVEVDDMEAANAVPVEIVMENGVAMIRASK